MGIGTNQPAKLYTAGAVGGATIVVAATDFPTGTDAFFIHWIAGGNTTAAPGGTLVRITQPSGNILAMIGLSDGGIFWPCALRFPVINGSVEINIIPTTGTDNCQVTVAASGI